MSVSFYDLMKYARTGIASPDMTGFDKLRARAAFGGYPVSTITGVPPISFKSDGKPLTSWTIAGAMQQTGTPTPDAPIMPEECGDRTANLLDYNVLFGNNPDRTSTYFIYYKIVLEPNTQYTMATNVPNFMSNQCPYMFGTQNIMLAANDGVYQNEPKTITSNSDGSVFIACRIIPDSGSGIRYINKNSFDNGTYYIMLNASSTAQPYEPFGVKIPLSLSTTPIYLDEPIRRIGDYADTVSSDGTVTRRIEKLVLTGEEQISNTGSNAPYSYTISLPVKAIDRTSFMCTHIAASYYYQGENPGMVIGSTMTDMYINVGKEIMEVQSSGNTVAGFKEYLASQYAAGTPVTVWYVLANATTSTFTAPTLTTAKGSNTLTVGTELQPSEMSVTGHIKSS